MKLIVITCLTSCVNGLITTSSKLFFTPGNFKGLIAQKDCSVNIGLVGQRKNPREGGRTNSEGTSFLCGSDEVLNDKRDGDSTYVSVHDTIKSNWRICPVSEKEDTFYIQLLDESGRAGPYLYVHEEYAMDKRDSMSTRLCVHRSNKSKVKFMPIDSNRFFIKFLGSGSPPEGLQNSYLHVNEIDGGDFRDCSSTRACAHQRICGIQQCEWMINKSQESARVM